MSQTKVVPLHDAAKIAAHFRRNPALHIYELGDLDPSYWPRTHWYALQTDAEVQAVVLLYQSPDMPTVLALGRDDNGATAELYGRLSSRLPHRYYAHLSAGLVNASRRRPACGGTHLKMVLATQEFVHSEALDGVVPLTLASLSEVQAFYERAYAGHWFDPRTLASGQYFGVRMDGQLAAVAGVHVYSPSPGVAAIGNVATLPDFRGRGLARCVTAGVCTSVLSQVDTIGLNVHVDNEAAIALYRGLGFETVGTYEEWLLDGPS